MTVLWFQRFMVSLVLGLATVAVGVPLAGGGTCGGGSCLVPAAGAKAALLPTAWPVDDYWRYGLRQGNAPAIIADGPVDDYWRDELRATAATSAIEKSLVDSTGSTQAVGATVGTFDWGDFGIGIGVAVGSMLVLAGLGAGALVFRLGHRRPSSAETA